MTAPAPQKPGARFARSPHISSLSPRHSTWVRDSTCLAAGSVGIYAAAPLVDISALPANAGALAMLASAIGVGIEGKRHTIRHAAVDEVIERLCPVLGMPHASRAVLKTKRWSRGWPGIPSKLVVYYDSAQAAGDSDWIADICEVFEEQGWGHFELVHQDHSDRRLHFAAVAPPAESDADSEQVQRAKRFVSQILGPSASVTSVDTLADTGEVVSMEVTHDLGHKLAPVGYRIRVERALEAVLPGSWRARWNLETDWVRFEQRTPFPDSIWLPVDEVDAGVDLLDSYDSVEIPYGVDEDGNVLVWRPAIDPNLMLIGPPGSGKTVTAQNLLVSFTRRGWPVWVLDGKGIEFVGYQDWPNVQIVATSLEEQVALIHRARDLMNFRYEKITSGEASEDDFEPVLLFLDEWAEFRGKVEEWWLTVKPKGGPRQPPVLTMLASMARLARTSRVHLVFGTQRPDAIYFVGDMRDNFQMRIAMGRLSPQGAEMMWQSRNIGTSVPRGCRGRGTTVNWRYEPVEIQCYRVPDPRKVKPGSFEEQYLDQLRPTVTRHPRFLITPVEPETVVDDGGDTVNIVDPTYFDYVAADWVLADDRPDIDPVLKRRARRENGGVVDKSITSPAALLGLADAYQDMQFPRPTPSPDQTGGEVGRYREEVSDDKQRSAADLLNSVSSPKVRPKLTLVPTPSAKFSDLDVDDDLDEFADDLSFDESQYLASEDVRVTDVELGDLVHLEDSDTWAVVDTDPEPDISDDDLVSVTYRTDDDSVGELSVPESEMIRIRKPAPLGN